MSGDVSALDRLHADDFTFVGADGTLITKAEMKAAFKSGDVKYESINNEDEKWRIYGNTAVYTALSTVKGTYKGQAVGSPVRVTRVYVKQEGGGWRAVSHQATPIAQGAASAAPTQQQPAQQVKP